MAKKKKRKLRPAGVWPFSIYNPSAEAEWSPLELFGGGEEGFYFAESDATARWQDDARTTPAGIGDPLGGLTDLSGNGHHAGQTTSAARPTLAGSGDAVYGTYDGDDWLTLTIGSGIIKNVAGATFWFLAEDDLGTDANREVLWMSHNSSIVQAKVNLGRNATASAFGLFTYMRPTSPAVAIITNQGDLRDPFAGVVTADCTNERTRVYVNGTLTATSTTTISDFENLAEAGTYIGNLFNQRYWNGKISHVGCIDRLITDDERAELDTWLAARKWA